MSSENVGWEGWVARFESAPSHEPHRGCGRNRKAQKMNSKIKAAAVGLALLTAMSGCMSVPGENTGTELQQENPQQAEPTMHEEHESPAAVDPASEEAPPEDPAEDPAQTGLGEIGDTFTYSDGMKIAIVKAEMKSPTDEYDDTAADGKYLSVVAKITNGTEAVFDAGMGDANVAFGADGEMAEKGFVSGSDYAFEGAIAPGKSKTAKFAFLLTAEQAKDLQIEMYPSWDHASVIFTGSAK